MIDEDVVRINVKFAQRRTTIIDSATARVIASWWHNGQWCPGYSFVSTGAINDTVRDWARDESKGYLADPHDRLVLTALVDYLLAHPDREPVPGWSELWVR